MANLVTLGKGLLGNSLEQILMSDDIVPGSMPSYELCKMIYEFHPIGAKFAEAPITQAMSKPRIVKIPGTPEEELKKAFEEQWTKDNCNKFIEQTAILSRVYGVSAEAVMIDGQTSDKQLDMKSLWKQDISYNVLDPLNIAGSVVLNQRPNALDFMKTTNIRIMGVPYHRSRSVIMTNGQPMYLSYVPSGFGFVGRSVYQRALFPLKSFIRSLVTDDLVVMKAGLIVGKIKGGGSIMDWVQDKVMGVKRAIIKEAQSGNVINVDVDEDIQTLNMQNLDGAYGLARKNLLENIASSDDMPAKLLNSETFAEGFGEGVEDAKHVASYVGRKRKELTPLYSWHDEITMYRAWNPEFYDLMQSKYSIYAGVPYERAFYEWKNAFIAEYPPLIEEEPSEKIEVTKVQMESWIEALEVLLPMLDPDNKATAIEWLCDNMNELEDLFQSPLTLDFDALKDFLSEQKDQQEQMSEQGMMGGGQEGKPNSAAKAAKLDSVVRLRQLTQGKRIDALERAMPRKIHP